MTRLGKTYHCKQRNKDNITIEPLDDTYLAGDLVVMVADKTVSEDPSQVALSRADALSLAWDIIEHFEEGTRPTPAIKVGDYVKSDLGIPGKVIYINGAMLNAKALHGIFSWHVSDCTLVTKQEFIDYYQQKIVDIANGQD